MKRGNSILLPLAISCLMAGSCAGVSPAVDTQLAPEPSRSILLSILSDRIHLIDPESGAVDTVVEGLTDFQAGFAAWAPDHRRFAYGDGGLVIVNTDTQQARTLLAHRGVSMPAWSPDGANLAYGDGRNLWITAVDRLHARYVPLPLTLGPLAMAWHPSAVIAFHGLQLKCHIPRGCVSTDGSDVWTVRPDGSGLSRVTGTGRAGAPKWSPDGARILFVRYVQPGSAAGELWMADADGANATRVSATSDVVAADWSADGTGIVVVRRASTQGELQVWLADRTGRHLREIGPAFPGTNATVDW